MRILTNWVDNSYNTIRTIREEIDDLDNNKIDGIHLALNTIIDGLECIDEICDKSDKIQNTDKLNQRMAYIRKQEQEFIDRYKL